MIQYIQNWENFDSKEIVKSSNNYIYISNSLNDLFEFIFFEYDLKLIKKTRISDPNGKFEKKFNDSYNKNNIRGWGNNNDNNNDDFLLNKYNIVISGDYTFIWDHLVYLVVYDK